MLRLEARSFKSSRYMDVSKQTNNTHVLNTVSLYLLVESAYASFLQSFHPNQSTRDHVMHNQASRKGRGSL